MEPAARPQQGRYAPLIELQQENETLSNHSFVFANVSLQISKLSASSLQVADMKYREIPDLVELHNR